MVLGYYYEKRTEWYYFEIALYYDCIMEYM